MSKFSKSIIFVALLLAACWGDPRNTVIPTDSEKWSEIKPAIEKLVASDKELFAHFMARHILSQGFGGRGLIEKNMTIGTALNKQKEFEKDAQLKNEQAEKLVKEIEEKNKLITSQMNQAATVAYMGKSYKPRDFESGRFSNGIVIKVGYKNTSAKDIAGIRATLEFYDIFGERLGGYNLESSKTIKAGESKDESYFYEVNQFENTETKIATTDDEKLKVVITVRDIIFTDNTKLSLEKTSE